MNVNPRTPSDPVRRLLIGALVVLVLVVGLVVAGAAQEQHAQNRIDEIVEGTR